MQLINFFDPWGSRLCTCPRKYSFSPYTGCAHGCLYCYASSYIPRFFECRPKKNLLKRLIKDLTKIDKNLVISMSNSSDPYPPMEKKFRLTRDCLRLLVQYGCKILLITKSNLVERDVDVLEGKKVCVSFSITTLNDELAKKLEPNAPLPEKRLKAIDKILKKNIPVTVRLDPIIPGINDSEIETVIKEVAALGVKHITSSTYKARFENWRRMEKSFPEIMNELKSLYFEKGERISNSFYLPKGTRFKLMRRVRKACDEFGLSFACCREGFYELNNSKSCDGSYLIFGC